MIPRSRPAGIEAGLAPFDDPAVGSVAPLVLVRSDPNCVDSAGDQYAIFGWPSKRGHGQPSRRWLDGGADRVFGASGSSAFYRAEALAKVGGYDPSFGSYYEDVDLAFRLRWAGYDCAFEPACRIHHDLSASYDHADPRLQERMARNAEVLFWSNLPAGWLVVAAVPHALFTLAQAGYRLIRNRHRPFVRGKVAAARAWSTIGPNRKVRLDLARTAARPPHFPIRVAIWHDLINHLHRPPETSRDPLISVDRDPVAAAIYGRVSWVDRSRGTVRRRAERVRWSGARSVRDQPGISAVASGR